MLQARGSIIVKAALKLGFEDREAALVASALRLRGSRDTGPQAFAAVAPSGDPRWEQEGGSPVPQAARSPQATGSVVPSPSHSTDLIETVPTAVESRRQKPAKQESLAPDGPRNDPAGERPAGDEPTSAGVESGRSELGTRIPTQLNEWRETAPMTDATRAAEATVVAERVQERFPAGSCSGGRQLLLRIPQGALRTVGVVVSDIAARGAVDWSGIVEHWARGRVPDAVWAKKMQRASFVAANVLVLFDVGKGMAPFRADFAIVVRAIRGHYGASRVSTLEFRSGERFTLPQAIFVSSRRFSFLPRSKIVVLGGERSLGTEDHRGFAAGRIFLNDGRWLSLQDAPMVLVAPFQVDWTLLDVLGFGGDRISVIVLRERR